MPSYKVTCGALVRAGRKYVKDDLIELTVDEAKRDFYKKRTEALTEGVESDNLPPVPKAPPVKAKK